MRRIRAPGSRGTRRIQRCDDGPKIFAFVAGDEMALYRKYGLVDGDGKPPA